MQIQMVPSSNSSDCSDQDQYQNYAQQPRNSLMYLKACIEFKEPISYFLYHLSGQSSFIIGKCGHRVLLFNTVTKTRQVIEVGSEDFVVNHDLPPFVFVLFRDRFIDTYSGKNNIEKTGSIRISKLQPRAIARFNKGYFLGGYNRSPLPGNKRTLKRYLYFISQLKKDAKNKPDSTIQLKDSDCPVSILYVQNPYIFAYCHPMAYLINLVSKEIVITFQKDMLSVSLLQGRYAVSSINGVGVGSKNTIFTFDVQRLPVFGVEINEHKVISEYLCLERTGRVFGSSGKKVFEYNPVKRQLKDVVTYEGQQYVIGLLCTPNNNLMVLRSKEKILILDIFVIQ